MRRAYCRKELEIFRSRWADEDDFTFLHRIVVVAVNEVDDAECPPWVKGQVGFKFYKFDGRREPGNEYLFFDHGHVKDELYYERARNLASFLWKRSFQITRRGASAHLSANGAEKSVAASQEASARKGHTIYLAVPASDMREAYKRLAKELTGWGHTVIPDPATDVPDDAAAIALFDDGLAKANFSIHLLGEKRGFALNDDQHGPIVPLQLDRARRRAAAETETTGISKGFRRIIWAPKILSQDNGGDTEVNIRDPAAVVEKFGAPRKSNSIVGDNLSKFVEFLGPHLARSFRTVETAESTENGITIYVNHNAEDEENAVELARMLKQQKAQPVLRALDGTPEELLRYHRDRLRDCDSVVVCWAAASEVAARSMWNELEDWRAIGRTKEFSRRGLIAGPPPGPRKKKVDVLFSTGKIDVIVDLTSRVSPAPEDLGPLFSAT